MTSAERARVELLIRKVNMRMPIAAEDVRAAEDLRARFPEESILSQLLEALLLSWSQQLRQQQAPAAAIEALQRAIALRPTSLTPRLALLDLQLDREDWPAAAQTARDALSLDPRSPIALEGLGRALLRLGRDQEASEVLSRAGTPGAEALLRKLRQGMLNETGMRQQELSAFTLRYDGEAHESVGREILLALDHHFATLTILYDHRPSAPVQVILFSREQYAEAAQAPSWSGGVFDNIDGRIRLPIGGLEPKLTPELDSTLLHELTHAFVADITHGMAPRDLHEGLAQFNEGKRLESIVPPDYLTALADGRVGGVWGLYWGALALVEYLEDMRGQSGINDLLRSMGETRDVDGACRSVYGQDLKELREAARRRLQQRHGS
jgi:tetratricopeptide (TPR) repeat protein